MSVTLPIVGRSHIKHIIENSREDGKLILCIDCPTCNSNSPTKHTHIYIEPKAFEAWLNGMLIHRALPSWTNMPDIRERLITGICSVCWDEMMYEVYDD